MSRSDFVKGGRVSFSFNLKTKQGPLFFFSTEKNLVLEFRQFSENIQIYGGHIEQIGFTEFPKFTENQHPCINIYRPKLMPSSCTDLYLAMILIHCLTTFPCAWLLHNSPITPYKFAFYSERVTDI